MTIPPGSTIGILGGGQLGRMLSIAAAQLGFKSHIFDPHESPCAADVAAAHTRAAFDDVAALERFAGQVDVITYEFENVPVGPLEAIADKLLPSTRSLAIAQDRASEKEFLERCGARVAPWRAVASLTDVACAASELGMPIVLKTRRYGYDGKGQAWIASGDVTEKSWQAIGAQPAVAESGIRFESEFSVIIARWADGRHAVWEPAENEHGEGILRRSTVPTSDAVAVQLPEACEVAVRIAEALDHVG